MKLTSHILNLKSFKGALSAVLLISVGLASEFSIESYEFGGDEVVVAEAGIIGEGYEHGDQVETSDKLALPFEIESFEHGDTVVSAPLMFIESIQDGVASVVWESIPGKSYRLCQCVDLEGGQFTDITGIFTASEDVIRLRVPVGKGCTFRVDLMD